MWEAVGCEEAALFTKRISTTSKGRLHPYFKALPNILNGDLKRGFLLQFFIKLHVAITNWISQSRIECFHFNE